MECSTAETPCDTAKASKKEPVRNFMRTGSFLSAAFRTDSERGRMIGCLFDFFFRTARTVRAALHRSSPLPGCRKCRRARLRCRPAGRTRPAPPGSESRCPRGPSRWVPAPTEGYPCSRSRFPVRRPRAGAGSPPCESAHKPPCPDPACRRPGRTNPAPGWGRWC